MKPEVSVVVPSYQGEQRLPDLLECLAGQRTSVTFEVVVVLDGSTDLSAELAKSYSDRVDLKLIERRENKGRSATLNEGFAAAQGDVLIRCDDDLLPGREYVETFADRVLSQPHVGVVGLYQNVYPDTPYAAVYGRPVDVRFRAEAYRSAQDIRWRYWAGNCAVHRQMWNEVGEYDDLTYRTYGWEDVDWGYRLVQAGGRIELVPELETPHRVAATTTEIRANRARYSGSAARAFDSKHHTHSLTASRGVWGGLVGAAASVDVSAAYAEFDRFITHAPKQLARKLIDLVIQAEFRRGYLLGP